MESYQTPVDTPGRQSSSDSGNFERKCKFPARDSLSNAEDGKCRLPAQHNEESAFRIVGKTASKRPLIFLSPRCELPDRAVFPISASIWKEHDVRWRSLSAQAGSHRQDGSTLIVQPRMAPKSLKYGMPQLAANRVKTLHVKAGDALPEWLDVVTSTFRNLEHLHLTDETSATGGEGTDSIDEEDCTSPWTSSRLRRLYVLYRLPELKSINGVNVTAAERAFAHPNDPNSQRARREHCVEDGSEFAMSSPERPAHMELFSITSPGRMAPERQELDDEVKLRDCARNISASLGEAKGRIRNTRKCHPPIMPLNETPRNSVEVSLAQSPKVLLSPKPEVLHNDKDTIGNENILGLTSPASSQPSELGILAHSPRQNSICQARAEMKKTAIKALDDDLEGPTEPNILDCGRISDAKKTESVSNEGSSEEVAGSVGQVNEAFPELGDLSPSDSVSREDSLFGSESDKEEDFGTDNIGGFLTHRDSMDLDRYEFVAVESSVHCDWGALTCGSLSLPYFRNRNNTRRLDAEKTKSRFRLGGFRRRPKKQYGDGVEKGSSQRTLTKSSGSSLDGNSFSIEQSKTRTSGASRIAIDNLVGSFEEPAVSMFPSSSTINNQVRIPASKSLTSPFPMQFRERAKESLAPFRDPVVTTLTSSKKQVAISREPSPSPPPVPQGQTSLLTIDAISTDQNIPLVRVKSSPSKLGQEGDFPPPSPFGQRHASPSPKSPRRRKSASWSQKIGARATSIFDDEDEENEDSLLDDILG